MPELPEVECTVRALRPAMLDKTIYYAGWVDQPSAIIKSSEDHFTLFGKLQSARVLDIRRKGKYTIIDTIRHNGHRLIIIWHYGLFGYATIGVMGKHPRVEFKLAQPYSTVYFNDMRCWGSMRFFDYESSAQEFIDSHVGIDPLSLDANKGPAVFKDQYGNSEGTIADVMLDQHLICGIGNIYRSEILWKARVHPARVATTLTDHEFDRLFSCTQEVLVEAIKRGGSSIQDYLSPDGTPGGYGEYLNVYGRDGFKCVNCSSKIVRDARFFTRAVYYCPNCQS